MADSNPTRRKLIVAGPEEGRPTYVVDAERFDALLASVASFLGDPEHPDWADYVATNLLDALSQVPDTGDWHGALRSWCRATMTGKLRPNRG